MKRIQASFTKRALLVGLLAGGGILAASSFAMPTEGDSAKHNCEARHGQQAHGKWEEKRAEHLSALKEKLKLTPGQGAAWNAFAQAAQPPMHPRADRQGMRSAFEKLNTPQRLDKMMAMSDARRARMIEWVQATKAFYAELTPAQQSVFDAEARPNRHRGHGDHHHQS
jgi:hypothetical protein